MQFPVDTTTWRNETENAYVLILQTFGNCCGFYVARPSISHLKLIRTRLAERKTHNAYTVLPPRPIPTTMADASVAKKKHDRLHRRCHNVRMTYTLLLKRNDYLWGNKHNFAPRQPHSYAGGVGNMTQPINHETSC